jgi:hypothetical protein|tara:strand:+ start:12587 stop:13141 length:555 start_codon:yes stop_codon:yes gene_type:complete
MKTYKEYLKELSLKKNSWEFLTTSDKKSFSPELIQLVQTAYKGTTLGSFINNSSDVLPSDWVALDWDKDDDLDVVVFYRTSRSNESWKGNKIQGIGHDGQKESKTKVIKKINTLLTKSGWWIEANGAMQHILNKSRAPIVTDEAFLRKLFNTTDLDMVNDLEYDRKIGKSEVVRESVFGKPKLK